MSRLETLSPLLAAAQLPSRRRPDPHVLTTDTYVAGLRCDCCGRPSSAVTRVDFPGRAGQLPPAVFASCGACRP